MTSTLLDTIELESAPNPTAAVIWMHGLGADGNDFVPIVKELNLDGCPAIRFVFPHAATMPVTINGGYVMRAWYDILGTDIAKREDEAGLRLSQKNIEQLIAREIVRGIPANHISHHRMQASTGSEAGTFFLGHYGGSSARRRR